MSVPGLPFFEDFLSPANAAGAGITATVDSLAESFGGRGRASPEMLRSNADAALACVDAFRRAWDDEASTRDRLSESWFGEAADAARSATDARLADASRLIDALESAALAMAECAAAMMSIGAESESTAAQFDRPTVGGRTADQVEKIAASAQAGDPEAQQWLASVLVPIVQQSAAAFGDLCDLTESALQSVLGEMRHVIDTYSIRFDEADDGHLQVSVTETASGAEKFALGMGMGIEETSAEGTAEQGAHVEQPAEPAPAPDPPEPVLETAPDPAPDPYAEPEPETEPEPALISQPAPSATPTLEEAGSL